MAQKKEVCPSGCFPQREDAEGKLWASKVDWKYVPYMFAIIMALVGWFARDISTVKDVNAAQEVKIAEMSATMKNIEKNSESSARSSEEMAKTISDINRNLFTPRR